MSLTLPNRVSLWNEKHLSELRISYDDEPTELSDFMALLKEGSEKKDPFTNQLLPNIVRLINCTNKYWKFSFDFDIKRTGGKRDTEELRKSRKQHLERGISSAKECLGNLQKEDLEEFKKLGNPADAKG